MAYLNSTLIKVFPTAHRVGNNGNESAFRLSEKYLGQLLTLSIKGDKFVKEIDDVIKIALRVVGKTFNKVTLTSTDSEDVNVDCYEYNKIYCNIQHLSEEK